MSKKSSDSDSKLRAVLTPDELYAYRQLVARLARDSVNQRIPNGHPAHAAILVESMFDHAQRDMRIFTGRLARATYDQSGLVDAACRFLRRPGSRLRILLQKPLAEEELNGRALLRAIKNDDSDRGRVEVRTAEGAYASDDAKHFAVMDDRGFRFEIDHPGTQAVANLNEPAVATELVSAFDTAFSLAKPLASI